jgi:hypothetical protein
LVDQFMTWFALTHNKSLSRKRIGWKFLCILRLVGIDFVSAIAIASPATVISEHR